MKRIKGDLVDLALAGDFDLIIHGSNAHCTMGSGIAKRIREVFPEAYDADCKTVKGDRNKLGEISFAEVERKGKTITIVNAYTQYDFGGSKVHVEYDAVEKCAKKIADQFGGRKIGYPKIGAGLARGNWHKIALILEQALKGCDHTLVEFDGDKPETQRRDVFYAGVGSRETPDGVLSTIERMAARLATRRLKLRTGGAQGADTAFWSGSKAVGGQGEMWLPWEGFIQFYGCFYLPTEAHYNRVSKIHPAWDKLSKGAKALHARNVGQVLGSDLCKPVDMVICWTRDGAESASECSRDTGGTGTAIRLASELEIPIYNLARPDAMERLSFHVLNIS